MSGSRARKILVRTLTGAALIGVVALVFGWAQRSESALPVVLVAGGLAVACALEIGRIPALAPFQLTYPLCVPVMAWGIFLYSRTSWSLDAIGSGETHPVVLRHVLLAAGFAFVIRLLRRFRLPGPRLLSAGIAAGLAVWVVAPLMLLPELWQRFGLEGTIAFVVLSKVGDITGYFVGNAIGRHHPFPNLSPGKTTEGCLGSLAGGIACGGLFAQAGFVSGGIGAGLLAGGVLNLAAQAGDLLESKFKRRVGIKDSSTWLGASGGFLDVLDSLFLTIPVALILWPEGF